MKKLIGILGIVAVGAGAFFFTSIGDKISSAISGTHSDSTTVDSAKIDSSVTVLKADTIHADTTRKDTIKK